MIKNNKEPTTNNKEKKAWLESQKGIKHEDMQI